MSRINPGGYVELFRFLNQKSDFKSFFFYDSIHQDFALKKNTKAVTLTETPVLVIWGKNKLEEVFG